MCGHSARAQRSRIYIKSRRSQALQHVSLHTHFSVLAILNHLLFLINFFQEKGKGIQFLYVFQNIYNQHNNELCTSPFMSTSFCKVGQCSDSLPGVFVVFCPLPPPPHSHRLETLNGIYCWESCFIVSHFSTLDINCTLPYQKQTSFVPHIHV